jgi:hypothetical protein
MALTGYGRKCALTIDYTKIPASLTDFPVLFTKDNLPSEMFDADGYNPALNGGGDIRFSSDSDGNTQLACEVVSFVTDNNPANGVAEIWVKVPSLSSSANTVIYVWYKKTGDTQPAVTDTYGRNNVWDSSFVMVQHMNDATSSTTTDSTANGNNGSKKGANEPIEADGKFGKGQNFDNTNDYIQIADSSSLDVTTGLTIEAWVKADTVTGAGLGDGILAKSNFADSHGAYNFATIGTTPAKWGFITNQDTIYNNTPSVDTWYYAVARYSKNNFNDIYVNNSRQVYSANYSGNLTTDSNNVRIGHYYGGDRYWDGIIDEVRISNVGRSTDWIGACYNNQNNPSTFASAGTPADAGGSTNVSINATYVYGAFAFTSPTVTAQQNISVSASALTATFTTGSATVTTVKNISVSATPLSSVFSSPSISVTTTRNITISASPLTGTFSINSVSVVTAGAVSISATTLVSAFSIGSPTLTAQRNITNTATAFYITLSGTQPTVSITEGAGVSINVSSVHITYTINSVTLAIVGNASINASSAHGTYTVNSATVDISGSISIAVSPAYGSFTIISPTITANRTISVSVSAVSAQFTVSEQTVLAVKNISVSATSIAKTFTVNSVTVTRGATISASPIYGTYSINSVSISLGFNLSVTPTPAAITFYIPTPVIANILGIWTKEPAVSTIWTKESAVTTAWTKL